MQEQKGLSMEDANVQPTQTSTDVAPAQAPSASDSSSQEQTQPAGQAQESTPEASTEGTKAVPYDRFKEVNDRARQYEEELQHYKNQLEELKTKNQEPPTPPNPQEELIKQQFKKVADELGYVSRQELQRQKEDEQVRSELQTLEKKYSGEDGRPKFDRQKVVNYAIQKGLTGDLEAAYKVMNEEALVNWHIQRAAQKSKGIATEKSDGSGVNSGTSNDELMLAYRRGDRNALKTRLARTKLYQKVIGNLQK
jgi:hypothetical protein